MASCTHNVASNRLIVATASIDIHDSLSYSYTRDKVAADDEELHHLCNNTIYPKKKVTSQNSSLFLVYISTTEEKIETINSVSLKMIFPLVVQYELTGEITVDE